MGTSGGVVALVSESRTRETDRMAFATIYCKSIFGQVQGGESCPLEPLAAIIALSLR